MPASPDLPLLDETLCNGSGDCVWICPTDCLAMAGAVPWMPNPAACVGCAVCVLVCPASALEMECLQYEQDADE